MPKAIRVNPKWLDGLPDDLQEIVRETAVEVFAEQRRISRANTANALEVLKDHGVEVLQVADPENWKKATAPLYDEYVKEHPETGPMIKKFNEIR